ncbi:MAG: Ger(x)C family spore germination protein [Eubacteriales bacterium]
MNKRLGFKAVLLLCAVLLSGCWSRHELNELSLIMGLGIDSADSPDKIKVVAQIAKPEILDLESNVGGDKSKPYLNLYCEGDNLESALGDSTYQVSRQLYLGQNQVVIFGRDKAENGIMDILNFLLRDHEARMAEYVIVSKTLASDILELETPLERLPSLKVQHLISDKTVADVIPVRIVDFISAYISPTTAPITPLVDIIQNGDEQDIAITGIAVFLGDKMVGELDKPETRGCMWISDKISKGLISIPTSDGMMNLEVIKSKTRASAGISSGSGYRITLQIQTDCNIAYQKGNTDVIQKENMKTFEANAGQEIKAQIYDALDKARSLKADIFGFGEMLHRAYPEQWDTIKKDWDKIFQELEVQVEAKVKLRGTGGIINNVETAK